MEYPLIDNQARSRYEVHVNGHTAFIEYMKTGDDIVLPHTEVPVELENQGVGSQLVKEVLDDIQKKGMKVVPLCPFVADYIIRHPQYNAIVAEGFGND